MELHEDPDFVLIIAHEEVVDLVEVVRLLDEHDEVLFFATQSFHLIFVYFFGPFVGPGESFSVRFQSFVSKFRNLTRDFCHGRQRVAPFYHDSLTTTSDRTTGLLLQSDRLVFGTR